MTMVVYVANAEESFGKHTLTDLILQYEWKKCKEEHTQTFTSQSRRQRLTLE